MRLALLHTFGLKITWGAGHTRLCLKNTLPSNLGKKHVHRICLLLTCVYVLLILILLRVYAYAVFFDYICFFSIRKHYIPTATT